MTLNGIPISWNVLPWLNRVSLGKSIISLMKSVSTNVSKIIPIFLLMILVNVLLSIHILIELQEFAASLSVQVDFYGINTSSSVPKSTRYVTHGNSLTSIARVVKSSAKSIRHTLKSSITAHALPKDLTTIRQPRSVLSLPALKD